MFRVCTELTVQSIEYQLGKCLQALVTGLTGLLLDSIPSAHEVAEDVALDLVAEEPVLPVHISLETYGLHDLHTSDVIVSHDVLYVHGRDDLVRLLVHAHALVVVHMVTQGLPVRPFGLQHIRCPVAILDIDLHLDLGHPELALLLESHEPVHIGTIQLHGSAHRQC